jgi:hypothetical protein
MTYLVPFSVVSRSLNLGSPPFDSDQRIAVNDVMAVLRTVIQAVPVDETWYRSAYGDVDLAIKAGEIKSARRHFIDNGYFEGRWPTEPAVDAEWYLQTYPDVAESIELGEIASPQEHFERHGYREGRAPSSTETVMLG